MPKALSCRKSCFSVEVAAAFAFPNRYGCVQGEKKKKKRIHTCLNFYCLTVSTCTEDVGRVQGEKKIYSVPLVKSAECEWHFRNCLPCPDILYTILYISV